MFTKAWQAQSQVLPDSDPAAPLLFDRITLSVLDGVDCGATPGAPCPGVTYTRVSRSTRGNHHVSVVFIWYAFAVAARDRIHNGCAETAMRTNGECAPGSIARIAAVATGCSLPDLPPVAQLTLVRLKVSQSLYCFA